MIYWLGSFFPRVSPLLGIVLVAASQLQLAAGQFQGCDYFHNLTVGQRFDVFSPGYPQMYRGRVDCRWTAVSPARSTIIIQCLDMNLPTSLSCRNDRILVSREGRQNLSGARSFCGMTTFTEESTSNGIVVAFRTPATSQGGRFRCQLTVRPPCECGRRNWRNRIVGGVEAAVNELPMMAAMTDLARRSLICGATIISNRNAITAAHCVHQRGASSLGLLVGEHDITTGADTPFTAVYTLNRVLLHAGYNMATARNDIAIVYTVQEIVFNFGVSPACLPFAFTSNTFAGNRVEAAGWGTLFFGGPRSNRLMRATLDVITNAVCSRSMSNIFGTNICTFTPGRDMCQYDSGGPLLWTNERTGILYAVGIGSHGRQCASSFPGVNTRVASYLTWITSNTPGIQYCRPPI